MSELIESIERRQMRRELPAFRIGDRVRVHFQVVEGTRRRTQMFEGIVIRLQGSGVGRTFTVRKLSFGVGVERTFPLHSPKVERLEIVARGEVRRAKLYYLRGRIGRRARLRERRDFVPEEMAAAQPAQDGAEQAESEPADQGEPEAAAEAEPEAAAEAGPEPEEPIPAERPADDEKEA